MNGATPTTQDTPDKGRLQINLVSDITAYPIQGARFPSPTPVSRKRL